MHSDGGVVNLTDNQVVGNGVGLFVGTGTITSYGNNQLDYNTSNGPIPTLMTQR